MLSSGCCCNKLSRKQVTRHIPAYNTFVEPPLDQLIIQDTDPAFLGVELIDVPGFGIALRQEVIYSIAHISHIEDHIIQLLYAVLQDGEAVVLQARPDVREQGFQFLVLDQIRHIGVYFEARGPELRDLLGALGPDIGEVVGRNTALFYGPFALPIR